MLLFLTACKTEFRKTIEKHPNRKVSVEYVYPNKKDTTNFSYVAYYENGDTLFKSTVKDMMFVEQKINYFDNGKIETIENLLRPITFDDSLYDCQIIYFSPKGDTIKSHYYKHGVKSFPCKYWLDDGQTLTGKYLDFNHTIVLWQWFDKNNKEIKQKKDSGTTHDFIAPDLE